MYILYVSNEVESKIAEWLLKTLGYKFKKIKVTPRTKGWMLSEFGTAKTPILCSEWSYWVGLQSIERFIGFQEHRFECGEWNRVNWSPDVLQLRDLWYSSVYGVEFSEYRDLAIKKLADIYGKDADISVVAVIVGKALRALGEEYGIYAFAEVETETELIRKVFTIEVFSKNVIEVMA